MVEFMRPSMGAGVLLWRSESMLINISVAPRLKHKSMAPKSSTASIWPRSASTPSQLADVSARPNSNERPTPHWRLKAGPAAPPAIDPMPRAM